jgi:eukaryotic-like serine/threonine-protein kinase
MAPTLPDVPSKLAAAALAPPSPAAFASSLVAALPPPPAAAVSPVAALQQAIPLPSDSHGPASSRTLSTPTGLQGLTKSWGRAASAVDRLGPGSTLGRYEILMPVAKGGMAAVWAARLQGTRGFKKIVAVKTMLPDVSDDPDFQSMFLDEARVAARIRHPNVVEILDLGEESDVLYLVMEWVDGETVSTLQKAAKPLGGIPQRIALRIASQICAGLHNAHELRDDNGALVDLVHRDISPANVLISTAGYVKIVDFGVAKSKGRLHITRAGGVIKGKTPYLSPEQLGGLPIDRRSDIFSLGALLYVLTTGLHPFRAETEMTTV